MSRSAEPGAYFPAATSPPTPRPELTDRELAVARLVGRAFTNKQIASELFMSPHTVNFHLRQLFRKLGINNRVRLACYVLETYGPRVTGPPQIPSTATAVVNR